MSDEESDSLRIPYFNKRVADVPCFRDSFFYGISGGFGLGVASFLFSSRVRRSCDIAVFSFAMITAGYWMHCRYQWSKKRFMYNQLKAELREYMVREGTEMNPEKPVDV